MDVKDLVREKMLAELVAERDQLILELFAENQNLKKEINELKQTITEKQDV